MASNSTCYYPDGTYVPTYSPCNSTDSGGVSTCCELSSSVCTTSGLCVGSAGCFYRGGCTDHSWRSPSCTNQCAQVRTNSYVNFYPCLTGIFDPNHTFCCGTDSNCCASNFTMDPGTPFAPVLSQESSTESSTSSTRTASSIPSSSLEQNSPVATVTPQSSLPDSSECLQRPQSIVGAAVGAPLGALFLFVLLVFAFRERRWRRKMAETRKPEHTGARELE